MALDIETECKKFSNLIKPDIVDKLNPLNKLVDDIHGRLEEFQTMLYFIKQEKNDSLHSLNVIHECLKDIPALFHQIDTIEKSVEGMKDNLKILEGDVLKAEQKLGITSPDSSTATKVTNILIPLFKKSPSNP